MKLSEAKIGDIFIFELGENPKYVCSKNNDFAILHMPVNIMFLVLQKNKKSVKCRVRYGRIEYIFKFDGVFNNYAPCEDYGIEIIPEDKKPLYERELK
jgi:hypothetical protein